MNNNDNNMHSGSSNNDFEASIVASVRHQMDRSCTALDGHTLSRLHRIRSTALAHRSSAWVRMRSHFVAFAAACMVVVAVGVYLKPMEPAVKTEIVAVENIEILANDELDFYENYEFYEWLAMN